MATLDDILAATKIIAEAETLVAGSDSKPEANRDMDFEGRIGDNDGSATSVAVSKRAAEVKNVVEESSLDGDGELHSGSANQQIDDTIVLDSVSNNGVSDPVDEVVIKENGNGYSVDKKIGNGEGSFEDINVKQFNWTASKANGVDKDVKQEDNVEKLEDENCGFQVGDFVWGKIKSHPWWPGQIYDIKDASEFALKYSQEGRMLVAFFGDGSCSWCLPSQLVPFVENFEDMSMDSRSKNSLNAMQSAVDEIGRIMESGMACQCIPKEKIGGLARPVVENAGVKSGVLMPAVNSGRFSVPEFEPAELLSKLRHFAEVVSVDNALELAVLKSRISAFDRFKYGGQLPSYHDPVPVEGLEDKNQNDNTVANDFSVPIEVPIFGPADDWLSSPSKVASDEKVNRKRKHKSMAELIGENTNVNPKTRKRATVKEGTDSVNETSLQKRKKSEDSSSGKISSKRKINIFDTSEINNQNVLNAETSDLGRVNGGDEGNVSQKTKEIEVPCSENTHSEEKEALEPLTSPRERKKSKYLSPPFTNVTWRTGNSSFKVDAEIGSNRIPKKSRSTDQKSVAPEENHTSEHFERFNASGSKSPQAIENEKKLSFSVSDVDVSLNEFLSKIRCAAVDRLYLSKEGSSDMVFAFGSALRSSTYVHGSDHKVFRQHKGTGKRKLSSLLHETAENDKKVPKAVKTEVTSKPKKKAKTSKSNAVKVEGKASPCLILTFKPGSPLPSKEDIVKHFCKFGSLNEQETMVLPHSNLVQVIFIKESEVKKAFESSVREKSFGFENIYETQLPSSSGSSSKVTLPLILTHEGQDSSDDLASDVRVITTKLEIMIAILAKYQSKFSEEDKSMLKEEIKRLMENVYFVSEKVETVSENVKVMAEEGSS